LKISNCTLDHQAQADAAAALAQLPSLRALALDDGTPLGFVSQLTTLTALSLTGRSEPFADLVAAAAQQPHLHTVELGTSHSAGDTVAPELLSQLLSSCRSLASLDIHHHISQEGLEVLMQLGRNISSVRARSIQAIHQVQPGQYFKWRSLELYGPESADVRYLAHLALQAVPGVALRHGLGGLGLPVHVVPPAHLPSLLAAAATNIAAHAARHPSSSNTSQLSSIGVFSMPPSTPGGASVAPHAWGAESRGSLFQALTPLGGRHVRSFSLTMETGQCFKMGAEELHALSSSLGKSITEIFLEVSSSSTQQGPGIILEPSFWPALRTCFPALTKLTLVDVSVGSHASSGSDLVANIVMCAQASPAPISFHLSPGLWQRVGSKTELERALVAWGLHHVTLECIVRWS
jgi:hypothetical protein